MAAIRRRPTERLLAWLVTGPAGHLWSGLADVVVFLARERSRRSREQEPD